MTKYPLYVSIDTGNGADWVSACKSLPLRYNGAAYESIEEFANAIAGELFITKVNSIKLKGYISVEQYKSTYPEISVPPIVSCYEVKDVQEPNEYYETSTGRCSFMQVLYDGDTSLVRWIQYMKLHSIHETDDFIKYIYEVDMTVSRSDWKQIGLTDVSFWTSDEFQTEPGMRTYLVINVISNQVNQRNLEIFLDGAILFTNVPISQGGRVD